MAAPNADRNLLFGILALQMDFITRDQLIAAVQTWVGSKTEPLGQLLCRQGALAEDTRALLDALVDKHLAQHDNDPGKSLAAVGSAGSVTEHLQQLADPQVQASLAQLRTAPVPAEDDPYATRQSLPVGGSSTSEQPPTTAPVRPPSQGDLSSTGVRFRILRPHARGGLGEVHVARDQELNREVALKQIQPHYASDADSQGRFLLEAEITGGLEHPGIVPVYGLGQYADGRPFYAMRFIRGDSLKEAIEHFHKLDTPGRDPSERSLELRGLLGRFVDVCNAIAYAHSRGVLHRDLKPGNIMLGKYGETLVVDWGLAKPVDAPEEPTRPSQPTQPGEGTLRPMSASYASHTVVGSAVGTPQFMSPEQAAGRLDQLGPASDVYSLGATLYTLLTGAPPVADTNVATVLQKVQHGDIRPPRQVKPSVPLPLDAICRKAMALTPADRYASPRDLADDIEHWLADEPVSAWREPWTVRARRWINRHRTFVTSAVSVVAVTIIGLAVATVLLTAAYERESAARQLAEEQRQRAEHNFQLARSAVDRYHTEVSEDVLLNEPGMEQLRERLLKAAREYYANFVDEHRDDPELRAEYGRALFRLAQITADIDSQPKAIGLHQQAIEVLDTLPDQELSTAKVQSDLARCWHHLGRLYRLTDRLPEAEDAYRKALATWGPLRKAHPDDDRYRAELARSQMGFGNVYQVTHRLDDARGYYKLALKHREELATAHRKVAEYQRDLAISRTNLGVVFEALGETPSAEEAYQGAITIQQKLVRDYPSISQYQNDLASTHYKVGDLALRSAKRANAETSLREAIGLWEKLVQHHAAVTEFHVRLAETYAALALVHSAEGAAKKAEAAAKQALTIREKLARDHVGNPRLQGNVARGYYRLGNVYRAGAQPAEAAKAYHEAKLILEQLTHERPDVPQYQADLARTYNSLGLLHRSQNDVGNAQEAFRKSLALWDKLATDHPEDLSFVASMSAVAVNLGLVMRMAGNLPGALERYGHALQQLQALTGEQRKDPLVRPALRDAYRRRAGALSEAGQYTEALEDWDQVIALAGERDRRHWQILRTVTLARSGAHAKAAADAEKLAALVGKDGEANYQLACAFARAAGAVQGDGKLQPGERQMLADRYVALAADRLRTIQGTKFFESPVNRARLIEDPEFAAIRTHPEFSRVVQEMGNSGNPMNKSSRGTVPDDPRSSAISAQSQLAD